MRVALILSLVLMISCKKAVEPLYSSSVEDIVGGKPNIILLLIDDMGFEVPTVDGGSSYNTPNLNLLAKRSVQFNNCYGTPLCSPSRYELLTGKYGFRNYTKWGWMNPKETTIATVLRSAGYKTAVFGKWQLGGGDASIKALGFEQYIVHDAFEAAGRGNRYRNPHLYTHGGYLPDSKTVNKYGDDIVQDSLFAFMSSSKKPYFVYYPMILVHKPFQPTPDDPNFLTSSTSTDNPIYYPSMVAYMDKLIGRLVGKLDNNTVLIVTSDNGTPHDIVSMFDGQEVTGGKGKTIVYGTHVPLYVYWKGHSTVEVDKSLIDFSDFMPTLAKLGGTTVTGKTDGVSFYHNIVGLGGVNRETSYCWFYSHPDNDKGKGLIEWVYNRDYKRYGVCTTPEWKAGLMFKYSTDPLERDEVNDQKALDSVFAHILATIKL